MTNKRNGKTGTGPATGKRRRRLTDTALRKNIQEVIAGKRPKGITGAWISAPRKHGSDE